MAGYKLAGRCLPPPQVPAVVHSTELKVEPVVVDALSWPTFPSSLSLVHRKTHHTSSELVEDITDRTCLKHWSTRFVDQSWPWGALVGSGTSYPSLPLSRNAS